MEDIKQHYKQLSQNGPYATLAWHNKGGYKSQYVAAVFDEAIMPYFKNSTYEKVIDFGCAAGILSNKLAPITRLTVGVDISPAMLQLAIKSAPSGGHQASYVQTDGKWLPFATCCFDAVISRESLLHVTDEDLPAVLREINRVLRDGKHFFLLDQVSESPYWQTQGALVIRRQASKFLEELKKNGFECIEARVVRRPRTFWIYLFWFKLLPKWLMHPLARLEIKLNRHLFRLETKRWQNVLFILRKVAVPV